MNENFEICTTKLKIESKFYYIFAIYRPPAGNINDFIKNLERILSSNFSDCEMKVIVGDLNLNLLNCTDPSVSRFISLLHSSHFVSMINRPTHFSPNDLFEPTLIDQIWVDNVHSLRDITPGILAIDFSDHCPIYTSWKMNKSATTERVKIYFRDFSPRNLDLFRRSLLDFLEDFTICADLDKSIDDFNRKLDEFYCRHFHVKIKFISSKRINKPWITSAILKGAVRL